jgi:glycosyltransferase involved in cell wall biosynthesis
MPNALRTSVIIPTYNRAVLLGYTLESLAQQDLPKDQFEVLVVDDGSRDATEAVARGFADRLDLRYFHQPDEGFRVAAARNIGIRHAVGDICLFVDSGVLLHSGCVRAHVASHDAVAGPAAVSGYVYCFNLGNEEAVQISDVVDVEEPDTTIDLLRRQRRWLDIREDFYTKYSDDFSSVPAPWYVYWTCNASARTEQIRAVGMFDEAFRRWGGEDIDLGYRLHRSGARFLVNRSASALHYPHDKVYDELAESALENYRYIAQKYATPITRLLAVEPTISYLEINDIIRAGGLPECAAFLSRTQPP